MEIKQLLLKESDKVDLRLLSVRLQIIFMF